MSSRRYRPTFEYKAGDLRPTVTHTLRDADGEPIDLLNAVAVRFYMQHPSEDAPRVNAEMDIVDESAGEVSYQWQEGDTARADRHHAEFVIQWPDGEGGIRPQTDPASGYYFVDFEEPIGRGQAPDFDGRVDITVGHIDADSGAFGSLTVDGTAVDPTTAPAHDHTGEILSPAEVNIGSAPDPADLPVALFSVAGVTWWVGTEVTAEMADDDVFIDIS